MKEKTEKDIELSHILEINKKLSVMIALLLRMAPRDNVGIPLKEQITVLDNLGVRPKEIAEIVGKTANHVNKELVAIRRESKKK